MESFLKSKWFLIILSAAIIVVVIKDLSNQGKHFDLKSNPSTKADYWLAPDLFIEPVEDGEDRQQLIYGEDLIANTSMYLGPNGKIAHISNGMNCQNCHSMQVANHLATIMAPLPLPIQNFANEAEAWSLLKKE